NLKDPQAVSHRLFVCRNPNGAEHDENEHADKYISVKATESP
ncbi:unnamed protein product, partial [Allacma fusca]